MDPSVPSDPEELALSSDPRLPVAVDQFNAGEWYACHDGLEELWHETAGVMRPVLQGILQIAVAQLHLSRGNIRGAVILTGEGLGRLQRCPDQALGLDLKALRIQAKAWLKALQLQQDTTNLTPPTLQRVQTEGSL
jgi:predicted metal-dependent hydrolase